MTFRQKMIAAGVWTIPIAGLDIGYMLGHGLDVAAIVIALVALAPAWMFLYRGIDLSSLGGSTKITLADISKAKEHLAETASKAVRQAEAEAKRLDAAVKQSMTAEPESLLNPPRGSVWIPIGRDDYVTGAPGLTFDKAVLGSERTIVLVKVDPGLILVNLRIEIEKRLNTIGAKYQVPRTPLSQTVQSLEHLGLISAEFGTVLRGYISFGNAAAHGAEVDIDAASEIVKSQDIILKTLDHIADYEPIE